MNRTMLRSLRTVFAHRLLFLAVLLTLTGCSTTRLTEVAAQAGAGPFSRLLVLGPPAMEARETFEASFAAVLGEDSGSTAVAGSPRLPDPALITPETLTGAAEGAGADGVLTVVPVNITVIRHPSPLGPYYYPFGFYPYYGYYSPFYDPVPAMRFDVLRLEMRLYPVGGRQPVWRALSETIDPTLPEQLASELATRVVADLTRRGLLLAPAPADEAVEPAG